MPRARRPGEPCSLRMERWEGDWPEPGDYLVSEAGSAYLVDEIRPARHGSRTVVFTAKCIKVALEDVDGAIFPISWAKRRKEGRW